MPLSYTDINFKAVPKNLWAKSIKKFPNDVYEKIAVKICTLVTFFYSFFLNIKRLKNSPYSDFNNGTVIAYNLIRSI